MYSSKFRQDRQVIAGQKLVRTPRITKNTVHSKRVIIGGVDDQILPQITGRLLLPLLDSEELGLETLTLKKISH